jgi:hypothetical protein
VHGVVTVEKWKLAPDILTEMQRTPNSLVSDAIDMLGEKYRTTMPAGTQISRLRSSSWR